MRSLIAPEYLSARSLTLAACCVLAWAARSSAEVKPESLLSMEGNLATAHVTDSVSGEKIDASKEIVPGKKSGPLRVEDVGDQPCVLTGEILLPGPKAKLTIQFGSGGKGAKGDVALDMGFDKEGDLRAGHTRFDAPLFKAGAPEIKQWLPFSLIRIGRSVRCSVANKGGECQTIDAEVKGLFIVLRNDARVRGLKVGALAVDTRRFVPVFVDDLPAAALSGSQSVLGPAALAADALPGGLHAAGEVPFCVGPGGLDISKSTKGYKEPLRVSKGYLIDQYARVTGRTLVHVPADEYSVLHVLAFSRDLSGGVPRMTVRMGRFGGGSGILEDVVVDVPSILGGAASYVRGQIPVKLADGRQGFLYHLVVPAEQSGNIWEFYHQGGKSVALEFTRDVQTHVTALDPNEFTSVPVGRPSSVIVLAATLERSPVEVSYTTEEAGNIFNEPQKPVFRVKLTGRAAKETAGVVSFRCSGPGTAEDCPDRDQWTAQAAYRVAPGKSAETALDLTPPSRRRGWYEAVLEVREGDKLVQQRKTSFALLAPDTRKATDDSPFGVWCFFATHTLRLESGATVCDKLFPIIRKAGWRWTYGGAPVGHGEAGKGGGKTAGRSGAKSGGKGGVPDPEAEAAQKRFYREIQEKYKLRWTLNSPYNAYERGTGWFDAEEFKQKVVPAVRGALAKGIDCYFKVLHESRSSNFLVCRLSELLGGTPYAMPEEEKARIDEQFTKVVPYCQGVKQVDPKAKVILVNDYPSVGIEFMKRSFPRDAFDAFGSEGAMFLREPERQPDWMCLLGILETWKRAKEKYGYQDKPVWTTEALYHSTNPGNLSLHEQGVRYVRDALLALANGVERLAAQGGVSDSTDDYRWSSWGCIGYCFRDPEYNPKPSYAMFAWLTQVLDQAKYAGKLDTGSTSLHLLDFARPGGEHVYPLWLVRGQQKVTIQVEGGTPVVYDPYGNPLPVKPADGKITLTVTDAPVFVTGAKVTAVAAREAIEVPRDAGHLLLDFDNPQRIRVAEKPSEILEGSWDYPRFRGNFSVDHVTEDGATAVRVELKPDDDPRKLLQRYVELELTEPLALEGRPYAFTARVKGNGGWGRIMFQFVDAKGRIWTSCGNQYPSATNSSDNRGDSYISFDGWQTLTVTMAGQYDSPDQNVAWPTNYNWWPMNTPEWLEVQANFSKTLAEFDRKAAEAKKEQQDAEIAGKKIKAKKGFGAKRRPKLLNQGLSPVDYPVKLTKVIVAMPPHILYVDGEIPVQKPVIYIDRIGVLDPPPGY